MPPRSPWNPGSGQRAPNSAPVAPWGQFVITDRNLITGQNLASAAEVARQLTARLARG
jgi:putative intracellular protease/amidase